MFLSKALKSCGLAQTQCETAHLCAANHGEIGSVNLGPKTKGASVAPFENTSAAAFTTC